jgi:hypothetical protein
MKKFICIALVSMVVISACKKNLPDPGATSAVKIANEWWVTLKQGTSDLIGKHVKIATYNTSSNSDSIWVDDLENTWQFKVKAKANFDSLTFTTSQAQNEYYNITVNLTNGKIFPGKGRSKTGNVTDSIYMQAEFSDDPGTIYTISGHARTRFAEDEY